MSFLFGRERKGARTSIRFSLTTKRQRKWAVAALTKKTRSKKSRIFKMKKTLKL